MPFDKESLHIYDTTLRDGAQQEAGEERCQHQQQQGVPILPGNERQEVGQRVGSDRHGDRHQHCDQQRVPEQGSERVVLPEQEVLPVAEVEGCLGTGDIAAQADTEQGNVDQGHHDEYENKRHGGPGPKALPPEAS